MACLAQPPTCLGEAAKDPACHAIEPTCIYELVRNAMTAIAAQRPAARRVVTEVTRTYFGIAGRPEPYVIVTVPPRP